MLESGGFDLEPDLLQHVMAISAGDSIYVAAPLLCDPAIAVGHHEIRRIVGNIGRAGIAFLIPPTNPMVKKLALDTYQLINHDLYDGKLEDAFQSTTLHLDFSGYEFPIDVGDHRGRNREAFFIESRVAVHDCGKWVADLDPLSIFFNPRFCVADRSSCCCDSKISHESSIPDFPIVAIDSWEELLESPIDAGVVRSHGNWLARLAAAAISINAGHRTMLLSGTHCRKCCGKGLTPIKGFDRSIKPVRVEDLHMFPQESQVSDIYIL